MRILILFYAVIGGVALAGFCSFMVNCWLWFAAPRISKTLHFLIAVASLGIGGILLVFGFLLHQGAPYDKNWWCLGAGAAVLFVTVGGCVRSFCHKTPI